MSSQQQRLTAYTGSEPSEQRQEVTAAAWNPGTEEARRCPNCGAQVSPRYRLVTGRDDCHTCDYKGGMDR